MRIIKTIKIEKGAMLELQKLECVKSVDLSDGGTVIVYLDDKFTDGKQTAMSGEFLCQFANKKWQRFGAEALNRTFKNPGREAVKQWLE